MHLKKESLPGPEGFRYSCPNFPHFFYGQSLSNRQHHCCELLRPAAKLLLMLMMMFNFSGDG